MTRNKLIISIVLGSLALILIIAASVAWFAAGGPPWANTSTLSMKAAEPAKLVLDFTDTPVSDLRYFGQTGTQYSGLDAPYYVEYSPINMKAEINQTGYMCINFSKIILTYPGVDEYGYLRTEEYTAYSKPESATVNLYDWFTIRMRLLSITDTSGHTVSYEDQNKEYQPENGFMVCTTPTNQVVNGQDVLVYETLEMHSGYIYTFGIKIVFQKEEYYRELCQTGHDLDESCATPFSDESYMYATLQFHTTFESGDKHTIHYNPNGGSVVVGNSLYNSYSQSVFGWEALNLPVADWSNATPTQVGYHFDGWFLDSECTQPVDVLQYVDEHLRSDVTFYAGWTEYPTVTYYTSDNTTELTKHYIPFGSTATPPSYAVSGSRVVGWSTDPTATYADTDKFFDFDTPINSDIELYPVLRRTYTVTIQLQQSAIRYATITHHHDGTTTVTNGSNKSSYSFTVYEGECWGDYLDSTSDNYIEITDLSGAYKFYGWTDSFSSLTNSTLIANNTNIIPNDYAFTEDKSIYVQTKLS